MSNAKIVKANIPTIVENEIPLIVGIKRIASNGIVKIYIESRSTGNRQGRIFLKVCSML